MALTAVQRKKIVTNLVNNCSCGKQKMFTENDREGLSELSDERLIGMERFRRSVTGVTKIAANALKKGGSVIIINEETGIPEVKKCNPEFDENCPIEKEVPGEMNEEGMEEEAVLPEDVPTEENEECDPETDPNCVLEDNTEDTMGDGSELDPANDGTYVETPPANNRRRQQPVRTNAMSRQQWINSAPPEIRSILTNAVNAEKREKAAIINRITSNSRNKFGRKYLESQSINVLKGMVALLGGPVQRASNYLGAAAPAINEMTANDENDVLPIPTMNQEDWQKLAKTHAGRA